MSEASLPYRRIYLDANILIRAKWPRLSQTMRTALETASYLSLPVVLLQSVEGELRAHSLRQLSQVTAAVAGKAEELNNLCEPLGIEVSASVPSEDELAASYEKCVDEKVAEFHVLRSAPPLRKVDELFEMAIHRQKPFGDKGKNFQDAVICLAAIDDLVRSGNKAGAFVSRDGIFDQQTLDELSVLGGVRMILFTSEESLNDDMRKALRRQMAREWLDDEELALKAVNENLSPLQDFIEANLEIRTRLGFSNRILKINRIRIKQIDRVETPPPWDRPSNEPVTITAKMTVQIHAIVRRPSPSSYAMEVLKVGTNARPLADRMAAPLYAEQEELLERTVDVEIKAKFGEGRYIELEPLSVALGNPMTTTYSGFARIAPVTLET